MGAFVAYSLYTALILTAFYLAYKLAMASEKQPAVNRAVLVAMLMAAFAAWPVAKADWGRAASAEGGVEIMQPLGEMTMAVGEPAAAPLWPIALTALYFAGLAATVTVMGVQYSKLLRTLRRGERREYADYTLIISDDATQSPFSWGRYVVMSRADFNESFREISAHELAHIRRGHTFDLTLAQAVCILQWFNPAAWLMRAELSTVHEYQADCDVIASGIDAHGYKMLLIKKAVGTRFQSLANSLNHSNLKKRITMMYKNESKGWRRLRALSPIPALVIAVAMTNVPLVADAISLVGESRVELPQQQAQQPAGCRNGGAKLQKNRQSAQGACRGKVVTVKKNPVCVAAQKMPEFPGGEKAMISYLSANVCYPADAQERGAEGVTVVRFAVGADGKISDPQVVKSADASLDAEAVRVISAMPAWKPGEKDGKKVSVYYSLPVKFAIPNKSAKKTTSATVITADGKKHNDSEMPIFVDGKLYTEKLNDIKSSEIESVEVKKNDPAYPNGAILITLKK